jgi:hypothetical protein
MQHDEAFLSLLSSQRELLNQLNMRQTNDQSSGQVRGGGGGGSLIAPDSTGFTNRPNAQRRTSMDMLLTVTKRFSMGMGMGYDQHMLPAFPMDPYQGENETHDDDDSNPGKGSKHEKDDKQRESRKKKRRLSSLGFITASFFEDHMKPAGCDSSSFEPHTEPAESMAADCNVDSEADDDHDVDDDDNDNISLEPLELDHSKYSSSEVKNVMEGFTSAMEDSQQSQQAIHDWDKSMGLKRSHSKTMRLSMRSRKKLKSTFKKEISALSTKL